MIAVLANAASSQLRSFVVADCQLRGQEIKKKKKKHQQLKRCLEQAQTLKLFMRRHITNVFNIFSGSKVICSKCILISFLTYQLVKSSVEWSFFSSDGFFLHQVSGLGHNLLTARRSLTLKQMRFCLTRMMGKFFK